MRRINLIFQGGGVRGVGFVGVLDAIENSPQLRGAVEIVGVGGTSAGAIIAALYAAGYSANELKQELKANPLSSLVRRSNALSNVWHLWRHKGFYGTGKIYDWLKGLLNKKGVTDFHHLQKRLPCRIVAANVTDAKFEVITDGNDEAASAVLRSLSIPVFFEPYVAGQRLFVDGGLLSNYPLWLFDSSQYPTVGVKLTSRDYEGATAKSTLAAYASSLIRTMLEAHDKLERGLPPGVKQIAVDASFVDSTNFEVTPDQQETLASNGWKAATSFDWNSIPEVSPMVYVDPHAAEVLEDTQISINKVLNEPHDPIGRRAYDFSHDIFVIRPDGSATIESHFRLRNTAEVGLTTFLRGEIGFEYELQVSFKDLKLQILKCEPSPKSKVVILPLENARIRKRFAIWFVPPIAPGEFREVVFRHEIPFGFERFARGEPDQVSTSVEFEESLGEASLTVKVAKKLGTLRQTATTGTTPNEDHPTETLAADHEDYNIYRWTFGPRKTALSFSATVVRA
jgi:NTE family protein